MRIGITSADPLTCVPPVLPSPPEGRAIVIGAGKAAARMAQAVEKNWQAPLSGLVITRHGHGAKLRDIEVVEAGHPVPEEASLLATQRICALVEKATPSDLILFIVSGGGSSLLEHPGPGLTMADIALINRQLLMSGAPISDMNCVRKHLSAVKGGRLADRAYPARLVTIAISDVPGDDRSVIASGPTVPDPTTCEMAREIVRRYGIKLPDAATEWLNRPEAETPKPGDPIFDGTDYVMASRPADMIAAVVAAAETSGLEVMCLGADVEGEAELVGREHAAIALEMAANRASGDRPLLIVSGGETTVSVRNAKGRGGRNATYLLSLLIAVDGHKSIHALAVDTDGIDGSEDNAGAFITPDTLAAAHTSGLDARQMLADNQSYDFFSSLKTLVTTGPTGTNVNDLRLILIQ